MLKKKRGKGWKKNKSIFFLKQILLETLAIRLTENLQDSSCAIIKNTARSNTWRNIGPQLEQSDWSILVIGPHNKPLREISAYMLYILVSLLAFWAIRQLTEKTGQRVIEDINCPTHVCLMKTLAAIS